MSEPIETPILIRQESKPIDIPKKGTVVTVHKVQNLSLLSAKKKKQVNLALQSAEKDSDDVKITTQNITFKDETISDISHGERVSNLNSYGDCTPSVALADFLSRPVLVRTISWAMTDAVNASHTTFAPWEAFFSNAEIKKKLDNYAFIRCNLRLKFLINASPFYYGAALASYLPLPNYDTNTIDFTNGDAFLPLSQRQHIWITPQNNQGGELLLPFFFHKNWLSLEDAVRSNWFGDIYFSIYSQLQSANGTTGTSLDIQVFAWAEDVELMGPTNELAMQSAEIDPALTKSKDEYSGMISKPASAIAEATNLLGAIPVIGPFMTASSIIASAVGNVAHLFGYTNVPNIGTQHGFKSQPFPQFASPEISVPSERLCLDPKNELSIDNNIHGIHSNDELSVSSFLQRESYLTTLTYASTHTQGQALFATKVCPSLHEVTVNGSITAYDLTPMYYASAMFKYWRGDIIFRFKIIASQYHKGRLRINFSPTGDISTTTDSDLLTTTFSRIIDIGSEDDVEIIVPYMQATPWLQTYAISDADLTTSRFTNSGLTTAPTEGKDNGVLTCKVMTKLTAPVASTDIKILVFVRGGDNLEVALPQNLSNNFTHMELQSGEKSVDVAGSVSGVAHPCRYLVNMGEKVTSFRQLMRRKTFQGSLDLQNVTSGDYCQNRFWLNTYARFYGYDVDGYSLAEETLGVSTHRFNYVTNTPLTWISNCFIGHRGSMTWDFNLDTTATDIKASQFVIQRYSEIQPTLGAHKEATIATLSDPDGMAYSNLHYNKSGVGGMSLTNQQTQTGLSANIPDYNMYKFHFTSPNTRTSGVSYDGSDINGYTLDVTTRPAIQGTTINKNLNIDTYAAIGPDYNCIYFLNVPTFYKLAVPQTGTPA